MWLFHDRIIMNFMTNYFDVKVKLSVIKAQLNRQLNRSIVPTDVRPEVNNTSNTPVGPTTSAKKSRSPLTCPWNITSSWGALKSPILWKKSNESQFFESTKISFLNNVDEVRFLDQRRYLSHLRDKRRNRRVWACGRLMHLHIKGNFWHFGGWRLNLSLLIMIMSKRCS